MATPNNTPTARDTVAGLRVALANALDNLPDVVNDPDMDPETICACCEDIAALSLLVRNEQPSGGGARVADYL